MQCSYANYYLPSWGDYIVTGCMVKVLMVTAHRGGYMGTKAINFYNIIIAVNSGSMYTCIHTAGLHGV